MAKYGAFNDLKAAARALGGDISAGQICCPGVGHSRQDRSLSVKFKDDGEPIVHSFSGDDPIAAKDHVRQVLGYEQFQPRRRQRKSEDDIARAMQAAMAEQDNTVTRRRVIATFPYHDASGTPVYEVVRFEPKDFRARRSDGNGGVIWNAGERRVVYRLPELLEYPSATIFLCEGEKDADRVASLGLCATTVAFSEWDGVDVSALVGRDVMILEDNDDAGRKRAHEAATRLHGVANTVRIVRLPDLPDKGDVSDWLNADLRRGADELANVCLEAPLWTRETAPPKIEEVKAETKPASEAPPPLPLPFINVTAWQDQPVPVREWAVLDRVPMANVTLLSGEGAIGKSFLALHLSVAHTLGRDWLGAMPQPGPAMVVACEDDEGELHRRLAKIIEHYGAEFAELKDLHALSLAGTDALLAAPDKHGLMVPTKLFVRITQAACDIQPQLIVLDNSADVYGGNENDRTQVRQFIGILRSLAIRAHCAVLLTSHPSLTGLNSGSGLSGSTAWHASVRARLYMKRATTDKDEEPDPDMRVLEVMKNNYGPVGETITLRWNNGLFLPDGRASLDKLVREQKAEQLFLTLLNRFTEQGRYVNDKSGRSYAPAVFAGEPEAKADRIDKRTFAQAMTRLFAANKIHLEPYGFPSRKAFVLTVGPKP
jgi:RecA-family ATPase